MSVDLYLISMPLYAFGSDLVKDLKCQTKSEKGKKEMNKKGGKTQGKKEKKKPRN